MKKRTAYPLERVYRLIEPGPVILLTTASKGRANVMPMSWLTMMEFTPPLVGCVLSNCNHSFKALKATGECVINIPGSELVRPLVACGNCHGDAHDKFTEFGLTPLPASHVAAPLIAECPANLECRVIDRRLINKYNFFVLEVLQAWSTPALKTLRTLHHCGMGNFMVSGDHIKLRSKMP